MKIRNTFSLRFMLAASACICASQASAQDYTQRPVSLNILADATFTARKMPLPFQLAYITDGSGVTTTTIQQTVVSDYLGSYLPFAGACASEMVLGEDMTNVFIGVYNTFAPYFMYFSVAQLAVQCYQDLVVANNVKMRVYQVLVPVSGQYDISYTVPGDFLKPSSDVYVTSYTSNGAVTQTLYSQDTVSQQTKTNSVYLTAGLATIQIDLGSASVYTNTAGSLISVNLNDSVYRTWVVNGFPVQVSQPDISTIISGSIGGTHTTTIAYNPSSNPNPMRITDGSTVYSNPSASCYIKPLNQNPTVIATKGTEKSREVFPRYENDATITSVFANGVAAFTTTRLSDYAYQQYNVTYAPIIR